MKPLVCELCGKPANPEFGDVALRPDPDNGLEIPFHEDCYQTFLDERGDEFFDVFIL